MFKDHTLLVAAFSRVQWLIDFLTVWLFGTRSPAVHVELSDGRPLILGKNACQP